MLSYMILRIPLTSKGEVQTTIVGKKSIYPVFPRSSFKIFKFVVNLVTLEWGNFCLHYVLMTGLVLSEEEEVQNAYIL